MEAHEVVSWEHCPHIISKAFKLTGPPSSPGCPWLPENPGPP